MQNKKLITAVLTAAFLGSSVMPVWADTPLLIASHQAGLSDATTQNEQGMNLALTMGTVTDVLEKDGFTVLLTESEGQEYEFYLQDTTWLVDGNGLPTTAKDLLGQNVIVAHAEAMTLSLPPQSSAMAVMVYDQVVPNYAVIEAITHKEDGSAVVTTNNGDLLVTIQADAQVTPFRTRNIVKVNDLQAGDTVVLYYDMVSPSLPAQASTNKVVQLEAAIPEDDADFGLTTIPTEPELISLRDIAEAMGLQLAWNAESRSVILSKDAFSATVYIGSTNYGINRMHMEAALAAEIRDGRTFVSSDVIAELEAALQ